VKLEEFILDEFIRRKLDRILSLFGMGSMEVHLSVKNPSLSTDEIEDYPLIKGREMLLRATLADGTMGECFTDKPMNFEGALEDLLEIGTLPSLIAVLNAIMRHRGLIEKTIHCTGDKPRECSRLLCDYLRIIEPEKIGLIGFQPAFIKSLKETFDGDIICTDLNPENVNKTKYGVKILDGRKYNERVMEKADIILVTGSTIANGTFDEIMEMGANKRLIFYGTTIAGIAALKGVERFCPLAE